MLLAQSRPGAWLRTTLLLQVLVALALTSCAEEEPTHAPEVLQRHEGPILIEDLPRLSGDYPPELIDGLSTQLVDEVNCIQPGVLAEFEIRQEPGYLWTTNYVPHLLRPEVIVAAEGVTALHNDYMSITSAYRDVGMQYYDWLWGQRIGFLAARPGSSRHQAGQAIDVQFHSTWNTRLQDYGWLWPYGDSDRPHFEWREVSTPNLMVESVRAFQRLWNRNNTGDVIGEDGIWGMQSETRMAVTQAEGFAIGGCDLDGDGYASPTIGGDDCRDDDAAINPGAMEICSDGTDQNCSGADLICGMDPGPTDMMMDVAADMGGDTASDGVSDTGGDVAGDVGGNDMTTADGGDTTPPDLGPDGSFAAWSNAGERNDATVETACGCSVRSASDTAPLWPAILGTFAVLLIAWERRQRWV